MLPVRLPLCAACTALLALAPIPAVAQTAMFRGDAAHTGVYHGGGATLVGLAWRAETGGDVDSSPVIAGNAVYVGSNDGRLWSFDLATGATRWSRDLGAPVNASPAVADGRVFVQTRAGVLCAVSAATGVVEWRVPTGRILPLPWGHESGDYYTSSPVIAGGMVIFGAGDGGVYALDGATGTRRWRAETGGRVRGTPAVADGTVFVGAYDGRVYAFALATGRQRWVYETQGTTFNSGDWGFDRRSIQSSPAVVGGTVYVGARDGFLYALDAATGARRWRFDHDVSWVITSPAVVDGTIYAGSSDGHFVQALDAGGREQWRAKVSSVVWSSPAVADSVVYFGDGAGALTAVDRRTGAVRWSFRTGSQIYSSPAVSGRYVVVGSTDGAVYALRAGNDPAVRRAVFYDSTLRKRAHVANPALVGYLADRGYTPLDSAALDRFLADRTEDRTPSVVVFAMDYVPASVAAVPLDRSVLRRYLRAGGKVVWTGLPPMIIPDRMPAGKLAFNWDAPAQLTGVPFDSALFDRHGVRATAEGRRWGLPERWRSAWAVGTAGVSRVLALDDEGHAAAWVRNYGGPDGTGWVVVPVDDPMAVYLVAEHRGAGGR